MQRKWKGLVFIVTSLDGFITRPDGDVSWLLDQDDGIDHPAQHSPGDAGDFSRVFRETDAVVISRPAFNKLSELPEWPYPGKDVIVMTTRESFSDDRVTVARDLEEVISLIEERGYSGVFIDSAGKIRQFLERGLVDELTVTTVPLILGDGVSLFGGMDCDIPLRLLGSGTTRAGGYVHARYEVLPPVPHSRGHDPRRSYTPNVKRPHVD
ncbi:dihydrofolate reductase family protein [Corynebacterium pygosceleis]|uniref:Dihydrofolate reductase family protein n=1 Tax=Corynebacterium pygosceleis TaxID=2800406 RepID=A0A9Q4C743_9CORY|nr:dihydrofolate reductase family protein [Corynebacterium pygosceleis]MCK7637032.1 dihydrofolate reductase family protein [Corynebacterium pygosceleis]MCK7674506.1 dihydrofolate reductase family protein [Corynebacterium pygosceleis]MCL0120196.1 dihydrofolate reductase family protein [Corynebacterium pygosceleis]MCX7443740.1 dihydrofolate reductase family protein [Corynebacterium pygosceleis]MCX7467785.1 dihydrofolate reductase family protein [Corynebacterium pygosceleis]